MGHILIVDDDVDSLNLCRTLLKEFQHKITTSSSAETALKVLDDQDINLLIVDVQMPQVDGFELLRRLKTLGTFRGSILMLTGQRSPEDVKSAVGLGAKDYMVKPIEAEVFKTKIQAIFKTLEEKGSKRKAS